jgi:hypothetical protein
MYIYICKIYIIYKGKKDGRKEGRNAKEERKEGM